MDNEIGLAKWVLTEALGFAAGVGVGLVGAVVLAVWQFAPWWLRDREQGMEALSSIAASVESLEAHLTEAVSTLTREIHESRRYTAAAYRDIKAIRGEVVRRAGDGGDD